jgi:hypothetical protein
VPAATAAAVRQPAAIAVQVTGSRRSFIGFLSWSLCESVW